jgi:hypothetical protein
MVTAKPGGKLRPICGFSSRAVLRLFFGQRLDRREARPSVTDRLDPEVAQIKIFAVRPDDAYHQWRKVPSRELSIALVADERFGRVTGWIEAS